MKTVKFKAFNPFYKCKKKADKDDIFHSKEFRSKAKDMVQNDMSLFNIIQTLQKLKAVAEVLVNNHLNDISKIEDTYFKNVTICTQEDSCHVNEFVRFMN